MRVVISVILFLIYSLSFSQNDSILYSFFVAGHTYGKPGINNDGFHPPFKNKKEYILSRPEIKFGVLTGDIVSPFPTAQDWDEIDEDIEEFGIPFYFAVGNHDMENRPLFESRYGDTYYYFEYQNDLFIVLDPNIDGWNISGNQLQFLQNVIAQNSNLNDNIYVFFHQILWRESYNQFSYIHWNSAAGRADSVNFWSEVEPMFRSLENEVFMFAGDLGASWANNVTYDHYQNIRLISSGMGDEEGENFVVVNINSDKSVHYDLICLSDTNLNCLGELTDYLVVSELVNKVVDTEYSNELVVYPNPTNGLFHMSTNLSGKILVQLFDINGHIIFEKEIRENNEFQIDISHIAKGVYFLNVTNGIQQTRDKLIKT
jgi:hypothetical protein